MKISNFKNLVEKNGMSKAEVDVEITYLGFFKRVETKGVYIPRDSHHWRWLDTGRYTPSDSVEALHALYKFKQEFEVSDSNGRTAQDPLGQRSE